MLPTSAATARVELHVHLDCSLSYRIVSRLAPTISREEYDREFIAPPQCGSLAEYLKRAPRGVALMQTTEALRLVTEDLFEQFVADRVAYAEIRFAPLLHVEEGLTPAQAVAAVDRAIEDCIASTGIEARLLLCTMRHFTAAESLATAHLLDECAGSRVVGLDIAGDEAGYPIDAHIAAFRHAIDKGHPRTAHAGEALGADSVWETLRELRPSRIGHGVRSIEDPALVKHLKDSRIHLEVCPSSNVQTGICDALAHHPVDRLFRAGVPLSINTDARTITNVTLDAECARLSEAFGWGEDELGTCTQAALIASFADMATKRRVAERIWGPGAKAN